MFMSAAALVQQLVGAGPLKTLVPGGTLCLGGRSVSGGWHAPSYSSAYGFVVCVLFVSCVCRSDPQTLWGTGTATSSKQQECVLNLVRDTVVFSLLARWVHVYGLANWPHDVTRVWNGQ